ncbi:MAG: hypothetical protein OHK003_09990 [Anaerolineales bacterium]
MKKIVSFILIAAFLTGCSPKTKDGKRFEFTGCCGETLPEPITEWSIQVEKGADGNYKVLSLPPYVP